MDTEEDTQATEEDVQVVTLEEQHTTENDGETNPEEAEQPAADVAAEGGEDEVGATAETDGQEEQPAGEGEASPAGADDQPAIEEQPAEEAVVEEKVEEEAVGDETVAVEESAPVEGEEAAPVEAGGEETPVDEAGPGEAPAVEEAGVEEIAAEVEAADTEAVGEENEAAGEVAGEVAEEESAPADEDGEGVQQEDGGKAQSSEVEVDVEDNADQPAKEEVVEEENAEAEAVEAEVNEEGAEEAEEAKEEAEEVKEERPSQVGSDDAAPRKGNAKGRSATFGVAGDQEAQEMFGAFMEGDKVQGQDKTSTVPPPKKHQKTFPYRAIDTPEEKIQQDLRKPAPQHEYFGLIFSAQSKRPPPYYHNYFLPFQKQPRPQQHVKVIGKIIPHQVGKDNVVSATSLPLSTLKIRWQLHRRNTVYKASDLYAYMSSRFGSVDNIHQMSSNSAIVVFTELSSAFAAIKAPSLGYPWDPLIADWWEPRMNNYAYLKKYLNIEESPVNDLKLFGSVINTQAHHAAHTYRLSKDK